MRLDAPGIPACVLGVLASVVILLRPLERIGAPERLEWSGAFAFLMFLEVRAIRRQRSQQRAQSAALVQYMTHLPNGTAAVSAPSAGLRDPDSTRVRSESLKCRTLALSDDLMRFLLEREQAAPELGLPATGRANVDAIVEHLNQTVTLYSHRFASRCVAMHDELAGAGARDFELDRRLVSGLTSPLSIRIAAERLRELAERLT